MSYLLSVLSSTQSRTGGEPTLCRHLIAVVTYINKLGGRDMYSKALAF